MRRAANGRLDVRTPRNWSRVLACFGTSERPRRGADGEQLWLRASESQRIEQRVRRTGGLLVVCTKPLLVGWWKDESRLPQDVSTFTAPQLTDSTAVAVLCGLCMAGARAVFVGDLDPYALVQYIETRRLVARTAGCALLYGGVDDSWLVAMDRNANRPSRVDVRIPLSRGKLAFLRLLEGSVDVGHIVGRRALSVLESGFKIELEGATNPGLYSPAHGPWMLRQLRSLAATHTPARRR